MKKNYLLGYFLMALTLLMVSCNQEEQITPEADTKTLEPEFFENDGSLEESVLEEEAPLERNTKSYSYYNYTLLKPADVSQEKLDAVCGETKTMPLLVGSRKIKVGEVSVKNDDENLYLTFSADDQKYMKKVYLYIGEKGKIPFYRNGFPNLRKFNFKAFPYYYGGSKKATYVVPLSSIDVDCFEIVAYSKIYSKGSRCYYTAFAYDEANTQTYGYSYYSGCYYYNDWVRSFKYCTHTSCDDSIHVVAVKPNERQSTCLYSSDGWSSWFWLQYIHHKTVDINKYAVMELYAEVSDSCDLMNAVLVGKIEITTVEGGLSFKYILDPEYSLDEINLYVGDHVFDENSDSYYNTTTESTIFVPYEGDLYGQTTQVFVTTNLKVSATE